MPTSRLPSSGGSKPLLEPLQKWWEMQKLKNLAARNLELAKAHQSANKLPAGHEHYQKLYAEVQCSFEGFSKRFRLGTSELEAKLPAVYQLRRLSQTEQESRKAGVLSWITAGAVTSLAVLFLCGAGSGVFTLGRELVLSLMK